MLQIFVFHSPMFIYLRFCIDDDGRSISGGVIAGVTIGGFAVVSLFYLLHWFFKKIFYKNLVTGSDWINFLFYQRQSCKKPKFSTFIYCFIRTQQIRVNSTLSSIKMKHEQNRTKLKPQKKKKRRKRKKQTKK